MPIEDVVCSVGVKLTPIADPAEFAREAERAAQAASGAAATSKKAATVAAAAGAAASAAGGRPGAFDPKPLAQQIRDLEDVLPTATKNRPMIEAAIAGYRDQLKRKGFDYDTMDGGGVVRPGAISRGMDAETGMNLTERTRRRDRGPGMVRAARTTARREEYGDYLASSRPVSRRGRPWRQANLANGLRFPGAIMRAGRSNVMTNGMFMNILFGGGEAAKAWATSQSANVRAALASDQASKAQVYLQQYQTASGGFLGRFANLAIDPFGAKQTAIEGTLGLAGVPDAASTAMQTLATMNRAGRTPAASTAVGASVRGLAEAIESRQAESRKQLEMIRQQGKTAGDVAEAAVKTTKGQAAIAAGEEQGFDGPAAIRERENMLEARLGAQRIYERAYDRQTANQKREDRAAVETMVTDSMVGQRRIKRGADNAARLAGDPVGLAFKTLVDTQADEMEDFDKSTPDLLLKLGAMGYSPAEAKERAEAKRIALAESHAAVQNAMRAEGNEMLRRQRESLGNQSDVMGYLNNNDPFGGQRSAINSKYDELRKETRKANFGVLSAEDAAAIERAQACELAGVDKSRADAVTALGIGYNTQVNVLRAGMDAASGRRSPYAPRVESIVGGHNAEAFRLRLAGMGSQIPRAREVARLQIDSDQAGFFAAFHPEQHSTLDEVDASGREVGRVGRDFASGRDRLRDPAADVGRAVGAGARAGVQSISDIIGRTVDRIDGIVANKFYRLSVDAMEQP